MSGSGAPFLPRIWRPSQSCAGAVLVGSVDGPGAPVRARPVPAPPQSTPVDAGGPRPSACGDVSVPACPAGVLRTPAPENDFAPGKSSGAKDQSQRRPGQWNNPPAAKPAAVRI